ncbi:Cathepsin_B [Hexamita inflata]|uniref:Cathepsin B n=1 Tax=Hexamita inflata TaxID=28002 RepID=A0AA86P2U6_9EUKA|nr:Cathepsin B [Hexamita inflata]
MFVFLSAVTKDYHNHAFLEMLKNIPDMTWTPEIPERFRGMSYAAVRAHLMPETVQQVATAEKVLIVGEAPAAFSWLEVRPNCMVVRNQGQCGSCWAFSSVGPLADNRCISKKDSGRVVYSEQYPVSCDGGNHGCDGGYLTKAMAFLKNTGTPTDRCVSYKSGNGATGKCPSKCDDGSNIATVRSANYQNVCAGEIGIKNALTHGTLQTAFTVYQDFMYYKSGIYQHKSGASQGGHAVVFVGYGEEKGVKYWVVRNSWGTSWGERGYFRIIRGNNECGIEHECYLIYP